MFNIGFADQNKSFSDFYTEVWVQCPACRNLAIAKLRKEQKFVRLLCTRCRLQHEISTSTDVEVNYVPSAHQRFEFDCRFL